MFARFGQIVVKQWPAVLIGWVVIAALVFVLTPRFETQTTDGEFAFLPADSPSVIAETLFRQAFPDQAGIDPNGDPDNETDGQSDGSESNSVQQNPLGSNIVLVVRRLEPLTNDDYEFIDSVLVPAIERTAAELRESDEKARLGGVWTYKDRKIGPLLVSSDKQATLVVLELTTEFLDRTNAGLIAKVEELIASDPSIDAQLPVGLDLTISGSATVGRDMLRAESESGERTETFTFLVVIGLLIVIYRAPLVAIIPLATVAAGVLLTLRLLSALAAADVIGLFQGLEVYVRVVMYGAGVDYCLFLIARYREGLAEGLDYPTALSESVSRVGPALATSAGTSIVGIGMMMTAEFGKFRQAGFGIALGLAVVLVAALTFAPAVLAMLEKAAFWPHNRREKAVESGGSITLTKTTARLRRWLGDIWDVVGRRIEARPVRWLVCGVAVLVPFALLAPMAASQLSYGLLSDLPQDEPSVIGAVAVQDHFPAGVTGPVSVLIANPAFADESAERLSETITNALADRVDALQLSDVRSQSNPLGISSQAEEYMESMRGGGRRGIVARNAIRVQARRIFLSDTESHPGTVMRLDLTFDTDPFDRGSIKRIDEAEAVIRASLPDEYRESSNVYLIGPTASIRDLKHVTDRDQTRIQWAVSLAVYAVIVLLLRRPAVCFFLIGSVVVSYMATIGLTYVTFYALDPAGFNGLDWKVPIFLFTLLIAMGEDYNILLMARVVEEQAEHGPVDGIRVAMAKTGGIISSCGLIMAGTFAALMSGTLLGMVQMGFALTAGVLMDTFLVRPVIVPAWLMLLNSGRLGAVGRFLGAEIPETANEPEELTSVAS